MLNRLRLSLNNDSEMQPIETGEEVVTLSLIKKGETGRVHSLQGDESCQHRLRELGLYETAQVTVLHINGSILCQVNDSRFALDKLVAEQVSVEIDR